VRQALRDLQQPQAPSAQTVNEKAGEPARPPILSIPVPKITFVHFADVTQVFVNGVIQRVEDPTTGYSVQRAVEAIEGTSAVVIDEVDLRHLTIRRGE